MSQLEKQYTLTKILAAMDLYRGLILDACENEMDGTDEWPQLRSRLLKILGQRGLEGRILEAFKDAERGI